MVAYNNKKYYIDIIETKPSNAISIIETDCEVDFAPPLDYKEPEKPVSNLPSKAPFEGYALNTYNPPSLKTPMVQFCIYFGLYVYYNVAMLFGLLVLFNTYMGLIKILS